MNKSIALMTMKQLWNRPVRLLLLAGFVAFPLVVDIMIRQMGLKGAASSEVIIGNTSMFVLIIGTGIIGQDVSDGILPLIFSRPIKRWQYILTKWLTVAFMASVVAFFNLICHLVLAHGFTVDLIKNVVPLDLVQIFLLSMGTTSVMLLLSSLLPGAADIGVILLLCAACYVMMILEHALHVPGMMDTAGNIFAILFPSFAPGDIHSLRTLLSIEVGRYFAILLVCLSGSVLLVNQREISYGSN